MINKVFGIDLGTTNSAISTVVSGKTSEVIKLVSGGTTLPSCVMWNDDGTFTVGSEAYKVQYLPSVASSVKKYMGTAKKITLKNSRGEELILSPEEVGAEVIKKLISEIAYLYPDVKDVCITVPAAFTSAARTATRRAGELAGLNVVAIINEPTSASLCYEVTESEDILIYDLGGGTFDTSILRIDIPTDTTGDSLVFEGLGVSLDNNEKTGEPTYTVVANDGDVELGGDNIDELIVTKLIKRFQETFNVKFEDYFTDEYLKILKAKVEKYKKIFHDKNGSSAEITVNEIDKECKDFEKLLQICGTNSMFVLKYDDLVEATKKIYSKTKLIMNRTLASRRVVREKIKRIILVGGSTENEILRQLLIEDFSDFEINHSFPAFEVVAQGAAIQAAISTGSLNMNVTDVVPYTIGVEYIDMTAENKNGTRRVQHLIKKDLLLPVIKHKIYSVDNKAKELEIKVYQGDGVFPGECELLGTIELSREEMSEAVELTLKIDTQGILEVFAKGGKSETRVQLLSVTGTKHVTKEASKFAKMSCRWRDTLEQMGVKMTKKVEKAFNDYEENGSKEAKEIIATFIKDKKDKQESKKMKETSNF